MIRMTATAYYVLCIIMMHDLMKACPACTFIYWMIFINTYPLLYLYTVFIAAATTSSLESAQSADHYILLANERFIHQLSLDGSRLRTIISEPNQAIFTMDYHIRYR